MKKFVSLLLCLVICMLLLVSCSDPVIGEDLDDYKELYKPEVKEEMELDFYITVGEGTTPYALTTISRMINTYLEDKYNTTLDIHFIAEDEYVSTTLAATAVEGEERADVILVLGYDMFQSLHSANSLINLNTYFASTAFGRLGSNDVISRPLLNSSIISETVNNQLANIKYVVPNNRVVGTYDYLMINKAAAQFLLFSPGDIESMKSIDLEITQSLLARVEERREALVNAGFDPDTVVVEVNDANYLDREEYIANGYICNISSYPVVTLEEAHESSFAIVKQSNDNGNGNCDKHYERCMEIIYALNLDEEFRNLLQYGVLNTTYTLDDNDVVSLLVSEDTAYYMNISHTGSMFKAYYNTYGWSKEIADAALKQNSEASVYVSEE